MSSSADFRWTTTLAALGGVAVGVLLMTGFVALKKVDFGSRAAAQPVAEPEPAPDPEAQTRIVEAWLMAQQFVEQYGKLPSSGYWGGTFANYQDPRLAVTDKGNNLYTVHAWVETEDMLGVKQRREFVCELLYEGGPYWHCNSLHFND